MPSTKKRFARRAKTKRDLQLTGSIPISGEILRWERDLLEPVIKALGSAGATAGAIESEDSCDG